MGGYFDTHLCFARPFGDDSFMIEFLTIWDDKDLAIEKLEQEKARLKRTVEHFKKKNENLKTFDSGLEAKLTDFRHVWIKAIWNQHRVLRTRKQYFFIDLQGQEDGS